LQRQNNFYFFLFISIIIFISSCSNNNLFLPKNGDLLFQDLDSSPLCDGIEKVTQGINGWDFSHIGIVTIINNQHYVLEAFSNGVDTVMLDTFLNRSMNIDKKQKVVVGRLKSQYSYLIEKAIYIGMAMIGEQYDSEFKIDNNKFYCSELIYDMFLKANNNKPIFKLNPMTYKFNGETLEVWEHYFENLNIPIPENEPGINPGGISLSEKITIVHDYTL
tara:strand:- start:1490 stop:2146 length:657 start_codon:yes stop_codon:yes gene_type:complete